MPGQRRLEQKLSLQLRTLLQSPEARQIAIQWLKEKRQQRRAQQRTWYVMDDAGHIRRLRD